MGGTVYEASSKSIQKTTAGSAYDSHAVSTSPVTSISFKAGQTDSHVRVGLSPNTNAAIADYYIGMFPSGRVYIAGASPDPSVTHGTYTTNDQFKVAVEGSNLVAFYKGIKIHDWGAVTGSLYAKVSPYESGSKSTDLTTTGSSGAASYSYLFDGCCRGGPAQTWSNKGNYELEKCQELCDSDATCNAIEVNGCNSNAKCGGACYHFYGTGGGEITNGNCVTNGDQKCYKKPTSSASDMSDLEKDLNLVVDPILGVED